MSVCGIASPTQVDLAAQAVCACVNGLPKSVLDASAMEDLVHKVNELRSAFGGPPVDDSDVLRRVDQWLHLNLWDWD